MHVKLLISGNKINNVLSVMLSGQIKSINAKTLILEVQKLPFITKSLVIVCPLFLVMHFVDQKQCDLTVYANLLQNTFQYRSWLSDIPVQRFLTND